MLRIGDTDVMGDIDNHNFNVHLNATYILYTRMIKSYTSDSKRANKSLLTRRVACSCRKQFHTNPPTTPSKSKQYTAMVEGNLVWWCSIPCIGCLMCIRVWPMPSWWMIIINKLLVHREVLNIEHLKNAKWRKASWAFSKLVNDYKLNIVASWGAKKSQIASFPKICSGDSLQHFLIFLEWVKIRIYISMRHEFTNCKS